jgi:DNA transposition AAA+ family ATPase
MNHPDNVTIDIEEMRSWVIAEKERRCFSWPQLAALIGVATGTLSVWAGGNYQGNNEKIAREVFKYRQMLDSQEERSTGIMADPGFFETPTSRRIKALMVIAHMGRITVAATGPGTGKTMAVHDYAASASNVWFSTMMKSTKSLNSMTVQVLRSINVDAKRGWGMNLSHQVMDRVKGRQGLLVIDEANHLDFESLEEIRTWHDLTGVGVCLLGNEELLARIEGGRHRDAFARLNSRIAQRHVQNLPLQGDVEAFCDGWGIKDSGMRNMLWQIAKTPGAGGLRECRQLVEQGSMLAQDEHRPLSLADLRDAQATRATRYIRT